MSVKNTGGKEETKRVVLSSFYQDDDHRHDGHRRKREREREAPPFSVLFMANSQTLHKQQVNVGSDASFTFLCSE